MFTGARRRSSACHPRHSRRQVSVALFFPHSWLILILTLTFVISIRTKFNCIQVRLVGQEEQRAAVQVDKAVPARGASFHPQARGLVCRRARPHEGEHCCIAYVCVCVGGGCTHRRFIITNKVHLSSLRMALRFYFFSHTLKSYALPPSFTRTLCFFLFLPVRTPPVPRAPASADSGRPRARHWHFCREQGGIPSDLPENGGRRHREAEWRRNG